MKRYSVQPRDRIFVKGYGFLSFTKNMVKDTAKHIRVVNTTKSFLIRLNNLQRIHLKAVQKE